MHVVAILALDGVSAFDLAIPCRVFAVAQQPDGTPAYEVRVCTERTVTATAGLLEPFRISSRYGLDDARGADTVIVAGVAPEPAPDPSTVEILRAVAADGGRVASICTGTFVLAAAGLLDGGRATTHWMLADRLAADFPDVEVDPGVLFVDNARVPMSRVAGESGHGAPATLRHHFSKHLGTTPTAYRAAFQG